MESILHAISGAATGGAQLVLVSPPLRLRRPEAADIKGHHNAM